MMVSSRQAEANIMNVLSLTKIYRFILGLNGKKLSGKPAPIQVIGMRMKCKPVLINHLQGKFIKLPAVGLQMDRTAGFQDLVVAIQEARRCKPFPSPAYLQLGIRE